MTTQDTAPRHVDDFIDDPTSDPYASSWFESFRRPAVQKMRKPDGRKLFATYQGRRYRVTGCSRMGDVWLSSDFAREDGYERRVLVDECSEWAASARSDEEAQAVVDEIVRENTPKETARRPIDFRSLALMAAAIGAPFGAMPGFGLGRPRVEREPDPDAVAAAVAKRARKAAKRVRDEARRQGR